jgi:hypothetical protein
MADEKGNGRNHLWVVQVGGGLVLLVITFLTDHYVFKNNWFSGPEVRSRCISDVPVLLRLFVCLCNTH